MRIILENSPFPPPDLGDFADLGLAGFLAVGIKSEG
jgi:hypothetical protein